ncbi:CHRD domain-containing protein [Ruegeria sp. HKCCA4008]|uniref:CHRD domain-containing protein n=1 Tax=Ruegeria sp. HKCCA4008 TaxID=2682999 RepID=UPI001488CFB8
MSGHIVVEAQEQIGANIPGGAWFVEEALQGNLYYSIHTAEFPAGEIRGPLLIDTDVTEGDTRTVTLCGSLNAEQEPGPTLDSKVTGHAIVVITRNSATGEVSYSSELSVVGRNEVDLNTPIPGAVSAIHLHNAPVGQNDPVVQDTLADAGATLNVNASRGIGVIGQDVISNQVETDGLFSIENVIGSDDGDVIVGSDLTNALIGEGGDDILIGCNSAISRRINPGDINKLKIGQATRIRLLAFAQANVPEFRGSIFYPSRHIGGRTRGRELFQDPGQTERSAIRRSGGFGLGPLHARRPVRQQRRTHGDCISGTACQRASGQNFHRVKGFTRLTASYCCVSSVLVSERWSAPLFRTRAITFVDQTP